MKFIPKDSKIKGIFHNDFDIGTSEILLRHVYKNIEVTYNKFYSVDSVIQYTNFNAYDYVFIVDIHPTDYSLMNLSDNIILLDHHSSALELNNPKKMHYVIPGACAAVLVKKFLENMYGIDLSQFDELVKLTNQYDMYVPDLSMKAKAMNDICFYLYGPNKFAERFKDGVVKFTDKEKHWLKEREELFKKNWKELEVFDLETINGCVIVVNEFINEIADKLMKEENYKIVIMKSGTSGRVSVRHCIEGFDSGKLLKEKLKGGGHSRASGCFCNQPEELKIAISVIEKYLHENFKEIRRTN